MPSTICTYLETQKKLEKQYGVRTVLVMQVGAFFEIYAYRPDLCQSDDAKIDKQGNMWNEHIGHAEEISIILNCTLASETNSAPHGITNPYKLGFPVISFEKNIKPLLANDWTVAKMEQEKTHGKTKRFITEVISPTTQLESISLARCTNNILSIYIEYQGSKTTNTYENFLITTGVSVVDILTGENKVCEFYSKTDDEVVAIQELYRFIVSHNPREIILHIVDLPAELNHHDEDNPNPYVKYIENILYLRRYDRLTCHVNKLDQEFKKLAYQIEFFNRIFTATPEQNTRLNVIQFRNEQILQQLGLDRMGYGKLAYMILLQHLFTHNKNLLAKLSPPDLKWIDDEKHLVLTHNAIVQLDLVSSDVLNGKIQNQSKKEIDSLMAVLDHCSTHLGRRNLANLIQNPLKDPKDIEIYYNMVEEMLTTKVNDECLYMYINTRLSELPDIARLQRKLEMQIISPKELTLLLRAYTKIANLYITLYGLEKPTLTQQLFTPEETNNFNSFLSRYMAIFDLDALDNCTIESGQDDYETTIKWLEFIKAPFNCGVFEDLEEQYNNLKHSENTVQQIIEHLNGFLDGTKGAKISLAYQKKKKGAVKTVSSSAVLTTTPAKATVLSMARVNTNICGKLQFLPYNTSEKMITSDKITQLCSVIDESKNVLRTQYLALYKSLLLEMQSYTFYISIANLIAKLDITHSYAIATSRYNYHRPIIDKTEGASYMELEELRHPIIERIINGRYVTNDLFLGCNTGSPKRVLGALIFGVNASGKTSLTKSVALNCIMAQIGCYTSCKLKYRPYSKIITRLSDSDQMFQALSTYEVEISEIRTMIRQADNKTLCCGDEIAHGTENQSSTSITATTILTLINKGATFIFATHMHSVVELPWIKDLPGNTLQISHFDITHDDAANNIIYNRKLTDGPGRAHYGIMVAKSLQMPSEFIEKAYEILAHIKGENTKVVETKKSNYNPQIYVSNCSICNKTNKQTELHSHHILEQRLADSRGLINGMHKNVKDNIIILCEECHKDLHKRGKEFETLRTQSGPLIVAI
jgi:DNA mismatch repair protein MutS